MPRALVAVLALSLLVACGGSTSPVVGTWIYDWHASITPEQRDFLNALPPEQRAATENKWAVEVEFRKDGTGRGNYGEFKWSEKDGVVTTEGAGGDRGEFHIRDGSLYMKVFGQAVEGVFRRK